MGFEIKCPIKKSTTRTMAITKANQMASEISGSISNLVERMYERISRIPASLETISIFLRTVRNVKLSFNLIPLPQIECLPSGWFPQGHSPKSCSAVGIPYGLLPFFGIPLFFKFALFQACKLTLSFELCFAIFAAVHLLFGIGQYKNLV